jgi:hypothetical protein
LSGFLNQGSAQPCSMQLRIVRVLYFCPCSSNSGSFQPG